MTDALNTLSAVEIQALVARGDVTCEQVAQACIDRIVAREPQVRAWAWFDPEAVLAQARALDQAEVRGPMHGVPIGVKDVIDTFDMPTQMGSPIYEGFRPPADASCVAILRAAGALILGKTTTCEFAGVAPTETTNPHDRRRTPGGSSSGSGAAVADYMVHVAFGTQTGGSIQRPSSYCGIVGYKPTYGSINPAGVKPAAETLDTVGLMARTVEDVELTSRALTNAKAVAWLSPDTKLRVGVCRTPAWETAEEASRAALKDAAERIAGLGHVVVDMELPESFNALSRTREIVNDYERARGMAHEWRYHQSLISEGLSASIRRGLTLSAEEFAGAVQHLDICRRDLAPLFAQYDVLLTPAVGGEAPEGLSHTGHHHFQSIWTQMYTPTVSLPTHQGEHGMPVSIQLVGRAHGDGDLFAAAQLIFAQLGRGPVVAAD